MGQATRERPASRAARIPRDALGRERLLVKLDKRSIGERRSASDPIPFTGHAAVYGQRTWIGPPKWGFYEEVDRDAFTKTITEGDVRFLINHDPNLLLARTKADTLDLASDSFGLLTRAQMAPTSYGNDLAISLERGDISQMSFGFETVRDQWETLDNGDEVRTLLEVKLFDVSVVTYPAYEGTDAAMRAKAFDVLSTGLGLDPAARSRLLRGVMNGTSPKRILRAMAPEGDDSDDDPVDLAQAVDAVLDELEGALEEGDIAEATDLLTSASATIDTLIEVLGGTDADEVDDADAATTPRSAKPPVRRAAGTRTRRTARASRSGREDATPPATTTGERNRPTDSEMARARALALALPGKGA